MRRPATIDPLIPDDVMPAELPREARAELRTVSKETADLVARHLVMAGRLIDDDPKSAYAHAEAARRRLPRIAVVREAVGLCAYANGDWAEALAELRASRRINGSVDHLPVMADCERGLGRPDGRWPLPRVRRRADLIGPAPWRCASWRRGLAATSASLRRPW